MLSSTNDALLREVAAKLTSDKSIHDFLFKADSLADISLLTSPLRIRHTQLHTCNATAVETSTNHAQVLDYRAHSNSLYIPAFSLDAVTLGLSVHQRTVDKRWPFLQPARDALHFTRFARFEEDCALLEVREARGDADIDVVLTTLRSPKRKSELRLSFSGIAGSVLAPAPTADALAARMRANLTQLSKIEYCRQCPFCATPPTHSCRCRTAGTRARHVLDLSRNAANATLYVGEYRGAAAVELFRAGVQALHAALECSDSTRVSSDAAVVEVLLQRAVRNRLSSYRLGPRREINDGRENASPSRRGRVESGDTAAQLAKLLTAAEFDSPDVSVALEERGGGGGREAEGMCRKEKNRMAAARSNLKRKWRNKSLRLNLVILRQRIAELRELENELRCEQMWLRQRCELELPELRPDGEEDLETEEGMDMEEDAAVEKAWVLGDDDLKAPTEMLVCTDVAMDVKAGGEHFDGTEWEVETGFGDLFEDL